MTLLVRNVYVFEKIAAKFRDLWYRKSIATAGKTAGYLENCRMIHKFSLEIVPSV